jgi:hypothetical protein
MAPMFLSSCRCLNILYAIPGQISEAKAHPILYLVCRLQDRLFQSLSAPTGADGVPASGVVGQCGILHRFCYTTFIAFVIRGPIR